MEIKTEGLETVEPEIKIHRLENYLKGKSLSMIGLIDGIGYTNNGYNYLDQLIDSIKIKQSGLTVFNAHFRTFSKEHMIEDFIASNISLKGVKKIQFQENEEKVKKILEDAHLNSDKKLMPIIRHLFKIQERKISSSDDHIHLKDALQNHEDVNVFYSSNMGCIHEDTPDWYLKREFEQRKRNYNYILSINSNAQIYTIGLITPNKRPNTVKKIEKQNEIFQELACQFGSVFIPIKGLERTLKGDCLTDYGMSILTAKCIEAMYERKLNGRRFIPNITVPVITQEKTGIDYLIEKSLEREIQLEVRQNENNDYCITEEIKEEKQKQKIYSKAKEDYIG